MIQLHVSSSQGGGEGEFTRPNLREHDPATCQYSNQGVGGGGSSQGPTLIQLHVSSSQGGGVRGVHKAQP